MTGDSSVSWVCMFSHQGVFPIGRIIFHDSNVVSNVENQGSFPRPFQMLWSARRAGYVVHGRWLEKPRVGMGSQWLCKAQSVAKTCRNHMWNTVMMRFAVNTRDFCSGGCHESSRKRRANRTKLIGVLATALVGSFFWIHPWSLKIGIMRTVGSMIALYHLFQYLRFFGRYYLPMSSSSVPLQKRCRTCLWTWLTQVHTTECFFWAQKLCVTACLCWFRMNHCPYP